jgi:hypothetical protein
MLSAFATLALACAGNFSSPAATGLEPLEPTNEATWPAAQTGDTYPEAIDFVTGHAPLYDWAHGRAYIHASLQDTWAALKKPSVVYDRATTSWSPTYDTRPEYAVSFRIAYTAGPTYFSVSYDVDWWEGPTSGTVAAPLAVSARWQKTSGTDYISLMEGSIEASEPSAGVTALELISHLSAAQSGPGDAQSGLQDIFNGVVADVHSPAP